MLPADEHYLLLLTELKVKSDNLQTLTESQDRQMDRRTDRRTDRWVDGSDLEGGLLESCF